MIILPPIAPATARATIPWIGQSRWRMLEVGRDNRGGVRGYRERAMKTVEIIQTSTGQSVPLPDEFRFTTQKVSIRKAGDAVILEPIKEDRWPERFFENIHIDDPGFVRPAQPSMPPTPAFD